MSTPYIPTRRDRIGVPTINAIARVLLSKGYRDSLRHAVAVGIAVNRVAREESTP